MLCTLLGTCKVLHMDPMLMLVLLVLPFYGDPRRAAACIRLCCQHLWMLSLLDQGSSSPFPLPFFLNPFSSPSPIGFHSGVALMQSDRWTDYWTPYSPRGIQQRHGGGWSQMPGPFIQADPGVNEQPLPYTSLHPVPWKARNELC